MRTTSKLACALVAGALAISGCGGDDSGSEEDTAAINELVTQINAANAEKDGAAYCNLLQPSTFSETFTSKARCVRETNQILEQAGKQPELVVEGVSVDGDTAKVTFAERSGEAPFVKENGNWYLTLGQGTADSPSDGVSEGSGNGGGGNGNGG